MSGDESHESPKAVRQGEARAREGGETARESKMRRGGKNESERGRRES